MYFVYSHFYTLYTFEHLFGFFRFSREEEALPLSVAWTSGIRRDDDGEFNDDDDDDDDDTILQFLNLRFSKSIYFYLSSSSKYDRFRSETEYTRKNWRVDETWRRSSSARRPPYDYYLNRQGGRSTTGLPKATPDSHDSLVGALHKRLTTDSSRVLWMSNRGCPLVSVRKSLIEKEDGVGTDNATLFFTSISVPCRARYIRTTITLSIFHSI